MPPKQKKPNNHENNEEEEAPFQAVILTDSFEEQFLPISHEMPRVKIDSAGFRYNTDTCIVFDASLQYPVD